MNAQTTTTNTGITYEMQTIVQLAIERLKHNIERVNAHALATPEKMVVVSTDYAHVVQFDETKIAIVAVHPALPTIFNNDSAAIRTAREFTATLGNGAKIKWQAISIKFFAKTYTTEGNKAIKLLKELQG